MLYEVAALNGKLTLTRRKVKLLSALPNQPRFDCMVRGLICIIAVTPTITAVTEDAVTPAIPAVTEDAMTPTITAITEDAMTPTIAVALVRHSY
jgi:hypothetical protein